MPNAIAKSLSRLSREKLIDLCVSWAKSSKCDPYLASNRNIVEAEEEDYLHEPPNSRRELISIYKACKDDSLQQDLADLSKKDIIDRIIDGDWRRGLSYHQLASIDFAKLEEDETAFRWTALKLVPLKGELSDSIQERPSKKRCLDKAESRSQLHYPQITTVMFVQNLKRHISPLVKAHYHVHRMRQWNLSIVRLHIQRNVPFAPLSTNVPRQSRTAVEASRCIYIALPDSCPYVYISVSGSVSSNIQKVDTKIASMRSDIAALKKIVIEAIPKALSRPQHRWSLEPTKLTAKSLRTVSMLRGAGKVGTTGGAFSQLTRPNVTPELPQTTDSVSDNITAIPETSEVVMDKDRVHERFGYVTGASHVSLDKVQVKIEDLFRQSTSKSKKRRRSNEKRDDQEAASMTITLSGSDVFAGLKQLALSHSEYVDLEKLSTAFSGGSHCSIITL